MNELGHYYLVLSIFVALTHKKPASQFEVVPLYFFLFTLSFPGSSFCHIHSDSSNYNVFTNSNANAPLFYRISGTWSNHEGSLLLWCWILSFYGFLFVGYQARPCNISKQGGRIKKFCSFVPHLVKNSSLSLVRVEKIGATPPFFLHSLHSTNLCSFTNDIRNQTRFAAISRFWLRLARNAKEKASFIDEQRIDWGIALFFYSFLLASSNPFVRIPFVCTKSLAELNPVLQDPVLAIHPPCIYAGYVASAIGFCLCLSKIMNVISALYLPMQKEGWVPPPLSGGDSRGPEAGDFAPISAFPVPNGPAASRVEKKKTLCSGCVEAHITSELVTRVGGDNAFSSKCCHPRFALMLRSNNRSLLMLRRFARRREGGPPRPPPPLQFSPSRGTGEVPNGTKPPSALSSLWPRERLKRIGTEQAKRVVRNANITYLLFCRTAICGANTVVSDPKYLCWWKRIRIWISICWCFLTVGILLGSWWAYHELGWGGWWFWDPVENASFMPWILATACIHSVIIPKLNFWTLLLNMVTYLCCVLGTFFVRSGLLASVHSFAIDSTRGIFLWCFFLIITSISLILSFQMKQPSSTKLVGALSDPSSNREELTPKPMNRILWHSRSTLFVHPRKFTRLARLMAGGE